MKKVDDSEPDLSNMSFVEGMLYNQDETPESRSPISRNPSCERLFSRTKLVMRPHRRLMVPFTLDTLLMNLIRRMNKDHWNVNVIQHIINKSCGRQEKVYYGSTCNLQDMLEKEPKGRKQRGFVVVSLWGIQELHRVILFGNFTINYSIN